jgi:hypothetical protein
MTDIKRLALTLILLALWGGVHAQYGARFELKGHEIGLEPVALRQVPAYTEGYPGAALPVSMDLLRGLRYKFHLSMEDGLRLGVFQQQQQYLHQTGPEVGRQEVQIQLGYERKLIRGYNIFFGGIDGLFNQGNLDWAAYNNQAAGNGSYQNFGANLFAGYRLFFTEYISATLEIGAYYTRTRYDIFRPELTEVSPYLFPNREFGVTSSLYLSFHFGELPNNCTCPSFH